MNQQQYESLNKVEQNPHVITANDLQDKTPRTLLWGYDFERNSWHVYLGEDGIIHLYRYGFDGPLTSFMSEEKWEKPPIHLCETDIRSNKDYVPVKRVYPCASDFEFCKLLIERGIHISFTNFATNRDHSLRYHGRLAPT